MSRYITLFAAMLATVSAGYGSSQPMQYGNNNNNNYGSQPPMQQYGNSGYGSQQMSQSWQGMSQPMDMNQMGVVIIATMNGGNDKSWNMQSSNMDMYGKNKSPMTHQVTVGAGLAYNPSTIQASPGDYVQFNFASENHTVTQSAFNTPCVKMMGGMDSGFMPNKNNMTNPFPAMKMQVMVSTPLWFYCRQKGHCGKGMVFSINPTMQKSQQMFSQMAMQQNGTMMGSSNSNPPPSMPSQVQVAPPPQMSVAMGQGQMNNGQCQCQCLCGTNAYGSGLGVGMVGGLPGMMPMSAAPSGQVQAPAPAMSSGAPAMPSGGAPAMASGGAPPAAASSAPMSSM